MRNAHRITRDGLCDDSIIEDFLSILKKESLEDHTRWKGYSFPTVFFTAVDSGGFKKVERWTKKIRISEYDILLFPIHVKLQSVDHWYLIAVFMKEKLIRSYDSLGKEYPSRLRDCLNYVEWEMGRLGSPIKRSEWTLKGNPSGLRLQSNAVDCGFFLCFYAGCILGGHNPASVKVPESPKLRDIVSHVLRRGKSSPLEELFGMFRGRDLFPGPTPTYTEDDLQRDLEGQMKSLTLLSKELDLLDETWEMVDELTLPPPEVEEVLLEEISIEEALLEDTEMEVDGEAVDPFLEIPDIFLEEDSCQVFEVPSAIAISTNDPSERVDLVRYVTEEIQPMDAGGEEMPPEKIEMETALEQPPPPVLSITAEADLLQDILDASQEESTPIIMQEQKQSSGEANVPKPREAPSTVARVKGQRMKRRTMTVTLKDGTRKRVNVKKLGLQVHKPFG